MKLGQGLVYYLTVVFMFAILFRFGIYYSFDHDTGYAGPIMLFHIIMFLLSIKVRNEK
jgi:hypothetical protein